MGSPLDYALTYVGMGWPVFPLCEGSKVPLAGSHGHHDATLDESKVRKWWLDNPRYNVSIATGSKSGLMVIDVDKQNGGFESMSRLVDEHGMLPASRRTSTPSGGRHLWFCLPEGKRVPTTQGLLGKGIDVKAERGSIIAPPSVVRRGGYTWCSEYGSAVVEAPEWLVEACTPAPIPVAKVTGYVSSLDAYTKKIVEDELKRVELACNGQRNATLSASAWNIGKLVNSGIMEKTQAFSLLMNAASQIDLPVSEARYIIVSAFRKAPPKRCAR